jgi:signal transduction histidine kinase
MMTSDEQALVKSCIDMLNALCERRKVAPIDDRSVSEPALRELVDGVNRLTAPENGALVNVIRSAGKLCHEINQPLTAISGYSELLMLEVEPDSPYRDRLEKIRSQVDRLGATTTELMDLLRGVYGNDKAS